jgi:hypothetical protein
MHLGDATKGVVVFNHEYSSARHVLYSDPGEQGNPKTIPKLHPMTLRLRRYGVFQYTVALSAKVKTFLNRNSSTTSWVSFVTVAGPGLAAFQSFSNLAWRKANLASGVRRIVLTASTFWRGCAQSMQDR